MDQFLSEIVLPRFARRPSGRIALPDMDDGAVIEIPANSREELVITTDGHVVKPVFFPGGDIGTLAAAGTLNDLAVMGARPLALTLGIVVEEGFPLEDLETILDSFATTLRSVDASLSCGDTKVMPAGELDGIVLHTTGVGLAQRAVSDATLLPGDRILVSGTIGDHGMALLAAREEFHLTTPLLSDVAALWPMIAPVLEAGHVHAMKDPTRGGLAAALNEMARKAHVCIEVQEPSVPIRAEVAGLSEILGISPLEVANEGKAILAVDPDAADAVLEDLRAHPLGRDAAIIGTVTDEYVDRVILVTRVGGRRFLEMPLGDPIPRIC